ncbi:hypothetical protein APED_10960 [Acanthopleuribacter pedis]
MDPANPEAGRTTPSKDHALMKRRAQPGHFGRIPQGCNNLAQGTTIENGRTLGPWGSRKGRP